MASERPRQPERTACWIEKTLVRLAKEVAAREEKTVSEVIERYLRAPLTRRHDALFSPPAEHGNPVG